MEHRKGVNSVLLDLYPSPGFRPTKTTCPVRITDPHGTDQRGRAGGRENPSFPKDSLSWVCLCSTETKHFEDTYLSAYWYIKFEYMRDMVISK